MFSSRFLQREKYIPIEIFTRKNIPKPDGDKKASVERLF